MRSQRLLRSLARALPLLVLSLAVPCAVLSQSPAPGSSDLTPESRARLAQAAEDSRLAPWQRDLMQSLARTGKASAPGSSAVVVRAALPALASSTDDGTWDQPVILMRNSHSAIYDPVRDRMVVFGGDSHVNCNDVWAMSLAGTPAWTQLTPSGTPPSARYNHSAIYDPVRDRMVVFGGVSTIYCNDVWAMSLAETPAWTQLTPSGTPPSARRAHSAIYDPVRDRMVVFGGGYSGSNLNDVWELSLAGAPAWAQLSPSGTPPAARVGHGAIYDPVRDRMVVFGGGYSGSNLNDVWELSLAGTPAWAQLSPSGTPPVARAGPGVIYDPVRDRMLVFGGFSGSYLNDVWALSLAGTPAWTQLIPSGTPPIARSWHSAIYDPVRDRMVVFGGYSGSGLRNDAWALSPAGAPTWTQLTPSAPNGRADHSAIYDPVRDRMVVFGGYHGSTYPYNDVWTLSLSGAPAWAQLAPSGSVPERYGHSAIYDPVRDRMVVFGGRRTGERNDVWAMSLAGTPAWTQLTPSGALPSARRAHSAIYDPVRDRMVVFGGYSSGSNLNDVWALSLATLSWTALTPDGTPPSARRAHSAIYDPVRDRMLVFGGYSSSSLNDVWALSLATLSWTALTPSGTPPSARSEHSAIYDPVRDRMVVFAGALGSGSSPWLDDARALSLADLTWAQLAPSGTVPCARYSHSAIYDPVRDCMLVFGGDVGVFLNDSWALEWSNQTAVDEPAAQPLISRLRAPAPNPTRGTTTVSYSLPHAGDVHLSVYDVSGRLVRRLVDGERPGGTETVVWDGTDESGAKQGTGVYFVRLACPGFRETRKVILMR